MCEWGKCFCKAGFYGDDCAEEGVSGKDKNEDEETKPADAVKEDTPKSSSPDSDDSKEEIAAAAALRFSNVATTSQVSESARMLEPAASDAATAVDSDTQQQLESQYSAKAAGLRSLSSDSSVVDSTSATSKTQTVTLAASLIGSIFAFSVGTVVGVVTMWYKQNQTRTQAQKYLFPSASAPLRKSDLEVVLGGKDTLPKRPLMPPMPPLPGDDY